MSGARQRKQLSNLLSQLPIPMFRKFWRLLKWAVLFSYSYNLSDSVVSALSSALKELMDFQIRGDVDEVLASVENVVDDFVPAGTGRVLPPFFRYREKMLINSEYKLSVCLITKVMSTLTTAIFCYLRNPAEFKAAGRRIHTETWFIRFCAATLREVNETTSRAELERTTKIAVIRHPIDRFLSGFVNKCILCVCCCDTKTFESAEQLEPSPAERYNCYGCGQSLSCFVQHFREQIWDVYKQNDPGYRSFITDHLAPQTWNCNFKEHLRDYVFIKHSHGKHGLSRVATEMDKILSYAGSPPSLRREITDAILVGRSHHSTFASKHRRRAERELYSNETLLHIVTELYYYDFLIFDYAWPTQKSDTL